MIAFRYDDESDGYVHLVAPGGHLSKCCGIPVGELQGSVSHDPVEVSCPVSRRKIQQFELKVAHEAATQREVGEAIQKLYRLRARLMRASSGEINSGLRDELLGLIDRR